MTNEIHPLYIWMQAIRLALTAVYLYVHKRLWLSGWPVLTVF